MQIKSRTIRLAVAILLCTLPAAAQTPVTVSLPEVTAAPGQSIDIPIEVTDLAGLGVMAADLLIHYDARVIEATGIRLTGTLTHRWSQAFRVGLVEGAQDTVGLIDIALATAKRIPDGGGTFVIVEFSVNASAAHGDSSVLEIMEAVLNNQDPQTVATDGKILVSAAGSLLGDFNGDCIVDFRDFIALIRHFGAREGEPDYDPVYDLDNNGIIGFSDFLIFTRQYGKTCGES
jgi:hypothetical protein